MKQTRSLDLGSVLLGAILGGVVIVMVTRVIPTMLARILSGMMESMKDKMEACGCNPQEMCQKMMAACPAASKEA